ncbi:MAG: hypothetical protein HZA50_14590 [Planctomycetes bacterium]|nr:hypothetical protein [Planctomycetota bacterium]
MFYNSPSEPPKHPADLKRACLAVLFLPLILTAVNCAPPAPPGPVNAVTPNHSYTIFDRFMTENYNTVIIVSTISSDKYAETPSDILNWTDYWHYCIFKVLEIEKDNWADNSLRYVVINSWPNPSSNIFIEKVAWPYMKGKVFAFYLDTTVKPAKVVGLKKRSPVPPYNSINNSFYGRYDEDERLKMQQLEDRVAKAVREYERQNNMKSFSGEILIDVRPDIVIYQIANIIEGGIYIIDKKTFNVTPYDESKGAPPAGTQPASGER